MGPATLPGWSCSALQAGRRAPHMLHRAAHAFGAAEGFAFTIIEAPRVQVRVTHTGHWAARFDHGPRYFPEVVSARAPVVLALGLP